MQIATNNATAVVLVNFDQLGWKIARQTCWPEMQIVTQWPDGICDMETPATKEDQGFFKTDGGSGQKRLPLVSNQESGHQNCITAQSKSSINDNTRNTLRKLLENIQPKKSLEQDNKGADPRWGAGPKVRAFIQPIKKKKKKGYCSNHVNR